MKNSIRLFGLTLSISMLSHICALPLVSLKELSADYVLDNILLKEQDEQKVQQTLNRLPEDIRDTLKERMVTRYKLQLFSALFIKTIPPHIVLPDTHRQEIALSHCGNYALIRSCDQCDNRKACLYDLATGQMLKELEGHTAWITSVAISPDRRYALTGSADKTARLWNLETGNTLYIFKGHTGTVISVAFSPNGKQALVGCIDNTARLWDVSTGQTIMILTSRNNSIDCDFINSVTISQCGKYALAQSIFQTIVWDLGTAEIVATLTLPSITLAGFKALVYAGCTAMISLENIFRREQGY